MRVVFMGTPDFSVPTLAEIVGHGHDVVAVYTRAPKPAGRGMDLQPSPVEREARRLGLPVHTPASLKTTEAQEIFAEHQADVAIVIAYGLILPKPILDTPELGCFNLHASLLPRWRGAAPINRAIMAGDAETGVMVMRMDEGLDTGDIAMVDRVAIGPDMTAGDLHDELARRGARLVVQALGALDRDSLVLTPQSNVGVTYAAKIDKNETRIEWRKPWRDVHNHIRGLSPFPGAWCEVGGQRLRILRTTKGDGSGSPGTVLDDAMTIACGEGAVRVMHVQPAGKRVMTAEEYLRGARLGPGSRVE